MRLFVVIVALMTACAPVRLDAPPVEPFPDPGPYLTEAMVAASDGHMARAEELLLTAASSFPDAVETRDVPYMRALLRLDPASAYGSTPEAVRLLDAYLATPDTVQYRTEAAILRRVALTLDSLQAELPARELMISQRDSLDQARERERELEREMARLREALEKSNAELERIRRRLTAPPTR